MDKVIESTWNKRLRYIQHYIILNKNFIDERHIGIKIKNGIY